MTHRVEGLTRTNVHRTNPPCFSKKGVESICQRVKLSFEKAMLKASQTVGSGLKVMKAEITRDNMQYGLVRVVDWVKTNPWKAGGLFILIGVLMGKASLPIAFGLFVACAVCFLMLKKTCLMTDREIAVTYLNRGGVPEDVQKKILPLGKAYAKKVMNIMKKYPKHIQDGYLLIFRKDENFKFSSYLIHVGGYYASHEDNRLGREWFLNQFEERTISGHETRATTVY